MLASIGDLAQSHFLRRHMTTVKTELDQLTEQVSTGRASDIGGHLQGDFAALSALDSSLSRLKGFASVTADLGLMAEAQQRALDQINGLANETSQRMLAAAYGSEDGVSAAGSQAKDALETVLSALNLRHADRALFAGVNTGGNAMADADTLIGAVQSAVAGASDAASVIAAVDGWLADPAGFGTVYSGGSAMPDVAVAAGETVALDITANDPAIKATLKGLILGALLQGGTLSGSRSERAELARHSGEALATNATARAALSGHLGLSQQRIAEAESRNSAEASSLEIARNAMVSVDPYDAATRLQDAETRLETLYALTARLSRLSLAEYL